MALGAESTGQVVLLAFGLAGYTGSLRSVPEPNLAAAFRKHGAGRSGGRGRVQIPCWGGRKVWKNFPDI